MTRSQFIRLILITVYAWLIVMLTAFGWGHLYQWTYYLDTPTTVGEFEVALAQGLCMQVEEEVQRGIVTTSPTVRRTVGMVGLIPVTVEVRYTLRKERKCASYSAGGRCAIGRTQYHLESCSQE